MESKTIEERLFKAFNENNNEEIKQIFNKYSKKNTLRINKKINGYSFLLIGIINQNIEALKLLFFYANTKNITLNINENDIQNIILQHQENEIKKISEINIEVFKLLYKNENEYKIDIMYSENSEILKIFQDISNKERIEGERIEKEKQLYDALDEKNIEKFRSILKYCSEKNVNLNIDGKNKKGEFLLLMIISKGETEILKLIFNYAEEKNIILNINEKNNEECYPFLKALCINNAEIVKLIIDYADKNNIILNIEEKDKNETYPLLWAICNNNVEMVKLIMNYANKNNIILYINENDIKKIISEKKYSNESTIKSFSDISKEIIQLLHKNEKDHKLNLKFKSEFSNIFEEIKSNEMAEEMKKISQKLNPTLVVATMDFRADEYYQLDIRKDEFLVVTDWNPQEGWVYGYRKENKDEKGLFPKSFIKTFDDNNDKSVKKSQKYEITPEYKYSFKNKVEILRNQEAMKKQSGSTFISIYRENLFENAYNEISNKSVEDLKKKLSISYIREYGIDSGGLLRDFFYQLSKEIGNVNYSLLKYSHDNSYELDINPDSHISGKDHIYYFKFIGRMLGLAIFHNQYLSIPFSLLFYKKLLNIPIELQDLEFTDPRFYNEINYIKNCENVEELYQTFAIDEEYFGTYKHIELKPNGSNILVTNSNKNEYIDLRIKYKYNNLNEKDQLNALKQGFYEIIPENINTIFNEFDLKLLISGIEEINVNDWENNTNYRGYNKNDITIINFWKCVREISNEKRTKLLTFVTGNSQVPVTGFKDLQGSGGIQKFTISKFGTPESLPKSHT
eukprot:jgi/Orpsp1_1/1184377/evm.model.c7180000089266.1